MSLATIGILASGRGSNLAAILAAIEEGRIPARAGAVVSNRAAAPALEVARAHGVPAVFADPRPFAKDRAAYDDQVVRVLKSYGVDLVALAGYMRLVSPQFLAAFPGRVLNIHPSLLPAFPGLDAQTQAVEYGARVSGCSVFLVDEGVDTGPILLQAAVTVLDSDTPESLASRILEQEHRLYPEALRLVAEGRVRLEGRRAVINFSPAALPAGSK